MRVLLLFLTMAVTGLAQTQTPATPAPKTSPAPEPVLTWHDVTKWGAEGRGWVNAERLRWFDRFPAAAQGRVPPKVWDLSRDSAGMVVRFKTDARTIWAHYVLRNPHLAGANMTAIGASGIDLYARDGEGKWRWAGVTRPGTKEVRQAIVSGLAPGLREYAAYLPLYNGPDSLEIGVPAGAAFEGLAPRTERPIVFYGTSITHGASASRPGMVHTAILGRKFDRPVINLGFSGNGKMEAEVTKFLAEIDAAIFVIDCLPNMNAAEVTERTEPCVRTLRAAHPKTPILLVEDRNFPSGFLIRSRREHNASSQAALRAAYQRLVDAKTGNLHYLEGALLLDPDGEDTTDGSHPSDLGFVHHARAFERVLRPLLTP